MISFKCAKNFDYILTCFSADWVLLHVGNKYGVYEIANSQAKECRDISKLEIY